MRHSPARAAADTAAMTGLPSQANEALADLDYGRWSGQSFAAIETSEPGALARWIADPTAGTPGGEGMEEAKVRIGGWLDAIAGRIDAACAITHAMIIRAAIAHALDMPLRATLAIDIAPGSRVLLSFNGAWRLQALGPLD